MDYLSLPEFRFTVPSLGGSQGWYQRAESPEAARVKVVERVHKQYGFPYAVRLDYDWSRSFGRWED